MNDPYSNYDPQTAFTLRLREAAQLRESAERLVREGAAMFTEAQAREARPTFSISRAINCAISNSRLEGPEREASERIADSLGLPHTPSSPHIPWSAFASQRTMVSGTAAQGGYLVADPAMQAIDILRPVSTCVRLGAQVFPGLVGDVSVPRVGTGATGAWVSEVGTATSGDWTLEQVTTTPKKITSYIEFSKQLLKQSPAVADAMIRSNLLGAVGAGIDAAVLSGTGTSAPQGILGANGVTVVDGGTFAHADAQSMLATVAESNVNDEAIKFLAPPATRELLAQRGVTGTASDVFLWQSNQVAGKPAYVSGNAPDASLFCADFSQVWLLMWGAGALQLELNPYAGFQNDVIAAKVIAHVDVAVVRPSAFAVGTAIT